MANYSAPDADVLNFKAWVMGILVAVLLLVFTIGQLNLLLGIEHEVEAEFVRLIPKSQARRFVLQFKTGDGEILERKIHSVTNKSVPMGPGQKVRLKVDGLFWNRVTAVDRGEGWQNLP